MYWVDTYDIPKKCRYPLDTKNIVIMFLLSPVKIVVDTNS